MSVTWPSFNLTLARGLIVLRSRTIVIRLFDMWTPVPYHNCFSSLKSLRHENPRLFTAILCVHRTFPVLFEWPSTCTKSHITTTLDSIHPTSSRWKKCTAILFTVARARFKCMTSLVNKTCNISRRRSKSVVKTVNSIIAHVTNCVICTYPARKWLNFASIFTDHSSARELSSSGNKFRYVVV